MIAGGSTLIASMERQLGIVRTAPKTLAGFAPFRLPRRVAPPG